MARIMSVDSTSMYRMLVTRKVDNGKFFQAAFGPYDTRSSARDYTINSYWGERPAKREMQRLDVEWDANGEPFLEWETIKTTYINGGEEVEWDD